ncbi:nucleotidyltransferase domain-containing protein [Desulfocicer niacini]
MGMTSSGLKKELLKDKIRDALIKEPEIQRIVLFGSFLHSSTPNDIDVAIFQNSNQKYIALAMKYRKLVRNISKIIPVDILPIKSEVKGFFIEEIEKGETIYER